MKRFFRRKKRPSPQKTVPESHEIRSKPIRSIMIVTAIVMASATCGCDDDRRSERVRDEGGSSREVEGYDDNGYFRYSETNHYWRSYREDRRYGYIAIYEYRDGSADIYEFDFNDPCLCERLVSGHGPETR